MLPANITLVLGTWSTPVAHDAVQIETKHNHQKLGKALRMGLTLLQMPMLVMGFKREILPNVNTGDFSVL